MNFELSAELQDIRKVARDFALKEILPTVDEDDKAHRFRRDLVKKMGELGFFGCVIPEEYGGNGMGFLAATIIAEEIARVHSSMRLPFNMNANGPALTILKYGSEELKRKYIPGLVDASILGCFAITEPDTGSDVASLRTRAVREGDCYVLNGCKTWISNAPVADVALVYASTDPLKKGRGISAFIVDMNTPGITVEAITEKLGTWAAPVGSITFENCRIPAANLIGKEGDGFKICMSQLDDTRLGCAAGALGVAQACLDASISYANEREQFGQPIGKFQMIQDMIAQMVVEVEGARLLVYRAAFLRDKGESCTREVSIGKYAAAEVANKCADLAMKIYGAYGYSEEYPVARFYRDAKSYQIVEGTSNIQKVIIASDALGYRKANR
ncbi:MAG: acyl-CoA dehydrogenase family protein [Peptococcaceae bacterium]|nr:acyl-CoA dehydrogenase family protein [Peptococcaceae bacterium]